MHRKIVNNNYVQLNMVVHIIIIYRIDTQSCRDSPKTAGKLASKHHLSSHSHSPTVNAEGQCEVLRQYSKQKYQFQSVKILHYK